jgi:hypothetical protein
VAGELVRDRDDDDGSGGGGDGGFLRANMLTARDPLFVLVDRLHDTRYGKHAERDDERPARDVLPVFLFERVELFLVERVEPLARFLGKVARLVAVDGPMRLVPPLAEHPGHEPEPVKAKLEPVRDKRFREELLGRGRRRARQIA